MLIGRPDKFMYFASMSSFDIPGAFAVGFVCVIFPRDVLYESVTVMSPEVVFTGTAK